MIDTKPFFSYHEIKAAADYIQRKTSYEPTIGLILGSGLSPLAEEVHNADRISYHEIPNFPVSSVHGHAGRLVVGEIGGQMVMMMQGRTHFYEGYSMQHITLPVRVMKLMGIETLVVTNAAGGINRDFRAGDLMLITDHINMAGFSGNNPLRGPNFDEFGPRFPSMTRSYHRDLLALARRVAQREDILLREGVYCSLAGPTFETPAELRLLQVIGADAVGMSTAPEVTVAVHAGMRVLGISSITNETILDPNAEGDTTHEEVMETGKLIVPKLLRLLRGILRDIN